MLGFAWHRLKAMIGKEFIQMFRDRGTFAMILMLPIIQLLLFGYAINSNPKYLPTVVINGDHSQFTRSFIVALQHTQYFKVIDSNTSEQMAERLLANGRTQFVINIPSHFTRDFVRGEIPTLLVTSDATDPMATANALAAVTGLKATVFETELSRGLLYLKPAPDPFRLVIHARYNPEGITQYQTVPGLIGVVLMMTMSMVTTIAIVREHERGTMEGLLITPVRPVEVMIGKIFPYILTGYLQQMLIILVAVMLFKIPNQGSFTLLLLMSFPFILANLMIGITFSTFAINQLQAVQMITFYFLPSILLSGFMFPFYGMPFWAQYIGEMLPLTHFLRIVRGIMLKGNGVEVVAYDVWPIILFTVIAMIVALKRYRQTLD